MGKSKIEWHDEIWNPVTGCTKVSEGCRNCYAERMWPRVEGARHARERGSGNIIIRAFTDVWCHEERLEAPLHWTKPRRVFVNSMGDLFHEKVPDEFRDKVFAVMELSPQHTFLVPTKRSREMREYFDGPACERITVRIAVMIRADRRLRKVCPIEPFPDGEQIPWPPPNVHLPAGCWTGRNGTRCHDHFVDADEMML